MNTQVIVRIDPVLKKKVSSIAKAEGKNISVVIRELLEDYIKNRNIEIYIDDLWQRIGMQLERGGGGMSDIDSIIHQIRTEK